MDSNYRKYLRLAVPVLMGIGLLPVPLLGEFHIESAVVASVVGCFWAGWTACGIPRQNTADAANVIKITGILYLFAIPLVVYAIIKGCFGVDGLGFWLLIPIPSILFGYAIGRLFRKRGLAHRRWLTMAVLLSVGLGIWLFEFFSLPQVYFYNHVWGYWPGPIYDESVQLTSGLFYFRAITLLWVILLWMLPSFSADKLTKWIIIGSAVALLFSYLQLADTGIISPRGYLQQQLGAEKETEHFLLYYDKDNYSGHEIDQIALEHEFYFNQISDTLNLSFSYRQSKIESYLYAHPWQKKKLVGAKFTSYVPIWLDQDQLHIAKAQIKGSLKHELVHVLAKQFGNRLFNGSWSIGLIEGLATALAPDQTQASTLDQIVVAERPAPGSEEMKQSLSPLGFYGGRSTVNYTTTGSFVSYLLRKYPAENFKKAYGSADIAFAYEIPIEKLVGGWHTHLDTITVDSVDKRIADRLFAQPSLFEQTCPRIMSDFDRAWDRYQLSKAERDTVQMLRSLNRAHSLQSENYRVKSEWVYQNLLSGNAGRIREEANLKDSHIDLQLLYADAFALNDEMNESHRHLQRVAALLAENPDPVFEEALATRLDAQQWQYYLAITYEGKLFDEDIFSELYYRTKIRAAQQAINKQGWNYLESYSRRLLKQPIHVRYFDIYLDLIHYLGFRSHFEMAQLWIERLESISLRPRYRDRIQKEIEWIGFLDKEQ